MYRLSQDSLPFWGHSAFDHITDTHAEYFGKRLHMFRRLPRAGASPRSDAGVFRITRERAFGYGSRSISGRRLPRTRGLHHPGWAERAQDPGGTPVVKETG